MIDVRKDSIEPPVRSMGLLAEQKRELFKQAA